MKPIKKSSIKEEVKHSGEGGEEVQNLETPSTNTYSGKSDILNESENLNPPKNLEKVDESTTTKMEIALWFAMKNFNLENKGYSLIAFDDKGEGKYCKLTLTNGEFTITVKIHEW